MAFSAFLSLLLPVLTLASPAARSVHSIKSAPKGWTQGERASADTAIKLRLTLPSADISALHATLEAVSTPGNPSYGQHLSREETGKLVAPTKETAELVQTWLASFDLETRASAGGDVLSISTTVGVAEKLLAPAEYYVFKSTEEEGRTALRTLEWGVPEELGEAVESAHPTDLFPEAASRGKHIGKRDTEATTPSSCANNFTPTCAKSLYNFNWTPAAASKNGVFVYAEGATSSKSDMKQYLAKYNSANANFTWTTASISGGTAGSAPSDYNVEATLDLDVILSLTAPTPVTLGVVPYSSDELDEPTQFLDFVDYVLNLTTAPTVTSFSYGMDEAQIFGSSSSAKVAKQLCNAFAQFGTRGISALVASGDSGTGGSNSKFDPDFPASCPYVTAVGATHEIPETTVDFSGGGFSNEYATASWQASAVSAYLTKLGSTDSGAYNKTGRGYPDVAAFGENWAIYDGGFTTVSGTSASCPNVAAIITALNDVQLAAGKSALGFLNPWIYNNTAAWNDITTGQNDASNSGFPAKAGWDPATGVGTPNYTKLVAVLP